MACYARPDFLTQLVCVLALFFLSDSETISRDKFRRLPIILLISIIYDVVYLLFIQDLAGEGIRQDGGREAVVKKFALHVTWVAMFYKIPFFFVLWKVSYNYLIDIKEVKDAPRIIKLMKIIEKFSDEAADQERLDSN
jgi:hypothetical protein|tara:strand:- start:122 stop:535 length:414 start_codon:yes stop_codon:yes gene_type:complete